VRGPTVRERDAGDLMRSFPAGRMRMWPISTRVNKPQNDDSSIVEPIELSTDAAYTSLLRGKGWVVAAA
jgi:putative SOS response-associated peptidase YedK